MIFLSVVIRADIFLEPKCNDRECCFPVVISNLGPLNPLQFHGAPLKLFDPMNSGFKPCPFS